MLIFLMMKARWQINGCSFKPRVEAVQRNRRHKTGHFAIRDSTRAQKSRLLNVAQKNIKEMSQVLLLA